MVLIAIISILSVLTVVGAFSTTVTSTRTVTATSISVATLTVTAGTVNTTTTVTNATTITGTVVVTFTTTTVTVISGNTTTLTTVITRTITNTIHQNITVLTSTTLSPLPASFVFSSPPTSQWSIFTLPKPTEIVTNNTGIIPQYNTLSALNGTTIGYECTSVDTTPGNQGACLGFKYYNQTGWYYNGNYSLLYVHFVGGHRVNMTIFFTNPALLKSEQANFGQWLLGVEVIGLVAVVFILAFLYKTKRKKTSIRGKILKKSFKYETYVMR